MDKIDEIAQGIINDAIDTNDTAIVKYEGLLKYLVKAGYKQAEKDLMEKFKMWVAHNGYTAQESELVYNDFKQFITEN